jgi:integrase
MPKIRKQSDLVELIRQGGRHRYNFGGSLYLAVRGGSAIWEFQCRIGEARKTFTLGSAKSVTVSQARDAKDRARLGRDAPSVPARHGLARAKGPLFSVAATQWLNNLASAWGADQLARNRALLRLHASALDNRPVREITTTEIGNLLRPGWTGPGPSAKSKVRGLIEKVLASQEIEPNPASWERLQGTHLDPNSVKTVSVASLPYAEVPRLMNKLMHDGRVGTSAIRFLVLTAVRLKECLGARWSEIDMKAKLWTIPAERMKGRKGKRTAHVVPLSDAAIACLGERGEGFIFPGRDAGHLGPNVVQKRLGQIWPGITLHGMRSSFTDWAAENGYPSELREMALAHVVGDPVENAYKRTKLIELRRPMMDGWAKFAA